jgi:hypothetical protein
MNVRRLAALTCLTLSLAACAGDARGPAFVVRDSAGVRIVENTVPQWTSGNRWQLDREPLFDIGSGDEGSPQLFRVEDVIGVGDRLAVVNAATTQVLLFDSTGGFERAMGGRGGGPGEFTRLSALYRCGGDTMAVNDFTRVSVFDPQGEFVRVQLVSASPGQSPARIQGIAADCSTLVMSGGLTSPPARGRTGRRSSVLYWSSADAGAADTIGRFPDQELAGTVIEGVEQAMYLAWGVDGVSAVAGHRLYHGSSEEPAIRVHEQGRGLVRIIRWHAEPQPVSAQDRALYAERREWLLENFPQAGLLLPPLDDVPGLPAVKPYFRSFLVDDESNLWVRHYPEFLAGRPDLFDRDVPLRFDPPHGSVPEVYSIFDPDGRWLGDIEVPPDLIVRSVHRNRLLAVWKDELDVEHVRAYRIVKP